MGRRLRRTRHPRAVLRGPDPWRANLHPTSRSTRQTPHPPTPGAPIRTPQANPRAKDSEPGRAAGPAGPKRSRADRRWSANGRAASPCEAADQERLDEIARATMPRWISFVPSQIWYTFASRYHFSSGWSRM